MGIKAVFLSNKKLAKSTLLYTVSSCINKIIPFILLTVITRYLSTEEYGIASMITVTGQMVGPFIMLGCSAAFIRKFIEGDDKSNGQYLFNGLFIMMVSAASISLALVVFRNQIQNITAIPTQYTLNLIIISIGNVFYDTGLAVLEAKEKPKVFMFLQIVISAVNALTTIILVVTFKWGLYGYITGLSTVAILKLVVSIKIMLDEIGLVAIIDYNYIKDIIFVFGIPMIPTQLKGTILTYSDRLFITNLVALSSTGIYSVGSQFAQPIEILCQSFNLAFVPWLYKKLNENDNEIKRKIVVFTYAYSFLFLIGAFIWSVFCKLFLRYLVGDRFADGGIYVIWLSLGYAFHAMQMMVVNYIYYVKKVNLYSIVTIGILALNLLLDYFFINTYGTIGAAQATMIVNFLSFAFTWILASHVYRMPWFSFWKKENHLPD